jgi:ribose-phosphate pyrophosphokinase
MSRYWRGSPAGGRSRHDAVRNVKLFGLDASKDFAAALAQCAGVPLAPHEERDFEDGEFKVRPLEGVRGEEVFVCQSLASSDGQSANDALARLLFLCGAVKDAGADRVVALVPYLAYARKDRRTKPRDPVTTRYVAQLFEAVGVDAVVTVDVHNPAAFENSFRIANENLEAAPLFAEHFAPLASAAERIVVLSPDAGGVKRARAFAALLESRSGKHVDLAFIEKQRSEGRVSGELFAGDVDGAVVIVIDDLISGGTTLARAAAAAIARGARGVHAAATHGVLAAAAAATLGGAPLESVALTDTVSGIRRRAAFLGSRLRVLECAPLFAAAIAGLARDARLEIGRLHDQ